MATCYGSKMRNRFSQLWAVLLYGLVSFCPAGIDAITITEIQYHPAASGDLGRRLEFIEIYNEDVNPRDLKGYAFVEGVSFVFRDRIFLAGHSRIVVCADEDLIRATYGVENTVGNWSPVTSLDNGGERVTLTNPGGAIVSSVRYNDRGRWPAAADGTGHSLSLIDPFTDIDDPRHWSHSVERGGTPGGENFSGSDPDEVAPTVVFNEALITTEVPWVELYNRGRQSVDLSGFHISDRRENLTRALLPAGTVIAPGEWLVLEDVSLGLDFSPANAPMDRTFVALVAPDGERVIDAFTYRPDPRNSGASEARVPDGSRELFVAAEPTPGDANRVDVSTAVVINEIQYHPLQGDPEREFVEIYNNGNHAIDLSGWRFDDGLNFEFPVGTGLAAKTYLVVARDPDWLRVAHDLPESVVLGPESDPQSLEAFGVLRNGGETVRLVDSRGNVVDEVRYHDGGEWPRWPDGNGSTLELLDPAHFNDCGQAWDASDDSQKAEVREFDYRGTALDSRINVGSYESEVNLMLLDRGIALVDDLVVPGRATTELITDEVLVEEGDEWRIFEGREEPPAAWKDVDFGGGDGSSFLRGDCDGDGEVHGEFDALRILTFNFLGGDAPPCLSACDADGDGQVLGVVTDAVYLLIFSILGGSPPPTPYPECGVSTEPGDSFPGCVDTSACGGGLRGPTPIGYGEGAVRTRLNDMRFNYVSFYARREFELSDTETGSALYFEIDYDDAFVAYLNGVEFLRRGLDSPKPAHDEVTPDREEAGEFDRFSMEDHSGLLHAGLNVLAVQIHNMRINDSDAYLSARLFLAHDGSLLEGWNTVPQGDFEEELGESWILQGNHQESGRTTLNPIRGTGSLKVVASGGGNQKVNRLETELDQGLIQGRNVDVKLKARWVVGSERLLTLGYNFGFAQSHQLHVPENLGTPGRSNSVRLRRENLGPVVDEVSQSPTLPGANEPVTVRARVRDPDGVTSVNLRYSLNSVYSRFESIAMAGPDPENFYTAEIPGQSLETVVVFEIVADDGAHAGRYPLDHLERTHPLTLDAGNPRPEDRRWAIYGHREKPSGSFPSYQVWMHTEGITGYGEDQLHSNQLWNASFVFGERRIYYGVGIRAQGSGALRGKLRNFRMRFRDDDPLHDRVGRFNLDNDGRDIKEMGINTIIRNNTAGLRVPFIDHTWVDYRLNQHDFGVTIMKEPPGRAFVSRWFPEDDEGDLFEMDERYLLTDEGIVASRKQPARWLYPPHDQDGAGDDKEAYRHHFNLRMDKGRDRFTNLLDTARLLDPGRTSNQVFDSRVEDFFNLEEFLRVLIVRQNTGDFDSWGGLFGKSTYFYRPDVQGRWYLIPWDSDISLGTDLRPPATLPLPRTPGDLFENPEFPEVRRMLSRPRIQRRYYAILKEMVETHFNLPYLAPYLAAHRRLGVPSNSLAHFQAGGYLDRRLELIAGWLEPAVFPQRRLEITTNGGDAFSVAGATVSLEGQAPAEVRFVLVVRNGEEVENPPEVQFSGTDFFGWTLARIPLLEGENTLELSGLDFFGDVVDSDTVTVTRTP